MLKQVKLAILGSYALLGAMTFSCSKQQDLAAPMSVKSTQDANEDLADVMANDELVKAEVLADVKFANDYAIWYGNLTGSQQRIWVAAFDRALENGDNVTDPAHSASEVDEYHRLQESRAAQIQLKYPQLKSLTQEEYVNTQNSIFSKSHKILVHRK